MTPKELKERTEKFSDKVIAFCTPLLDDRKTNEMADQLLRSGTALDANYGSAQRGRSNDEFIARLGLALDDASEARGWSERLKRSGLVEEDTASLEWLVTESDELTRIFASAYNTARENREKRRQEEKRKSRRTRRRKGER